MKKKIIFTAFNLDTGGVEKCLVNLVNNLDKNKYEITVFLQVKEGIYLDNLNENIKVESLNLTKVKNKILKKLINTFKFIKIIIKKYHKYDISVCYAPGYVPSAIIGYITSKNNISWMHTNLLTYMENYKPYENLNLTNEKKVKKFVNRVFFRKFKKNIFVSKNARSAYLQVYPQDENKCYTIYNLIDYETIIDKSKVKINLKKAKKFTFINIGRQTEFDKRLSRIIDATDMLYKEYKDFQVVLVGKGQDTLKYKKQVEKLKLNNVIKFIDSQKNPYPYFLLGDVFLLSSEFEGLPTTVLEAFVLNIPVISTNVSDVKDLISSKYGIVIEKNSKDLYLAMKEMIKSSKKYNKKFNFEKYNEEIITKLEGIFNNE